MFASPEYLSVSNWDGALAVALGERDRYSREHSDRVCGLCAEMGQGLGLSRPDLQVLVIASLLHDIGKIGIPDSVLLKEGVLEAEEWELMKTHSDKGESIFRALEIENTEDIALTIRFHHEHFDGNGYPDGLAGEDIPVTSRLITLADSYDAMTTKRSYHGARTHRQTMEIILEESGTKMDPYLVSQFARLIEHSRHRVH